MNTELGMIPFDESWEYIEWTTRKKEYKKSDKTESHIGWKLVGAQT